ncbi:M78 family metallopeptidase domain-containing protein [Tepidibacter formicigenes]|uniref:SprT-like family protein n=1 Tax=Tepidibacter formicigenes DSM 15518 TaxID=1123349 RepID=A0A1M6LUW9_9FIRM|nr:hypothetical protein [Tepidibacter formicigenes]SHJ74892.1 hypothetical protein SAMN02744037_00739 [Tepidibacter formicigenes DSM 15518]
MKYQPKIIKCRLKTGGKTINEIREQNKGQGLTYRDFENIQKAYEEFDGVVLLLSLWDYDNHESYHVYGWDDEVDEKMMMGIYHAEQTHPFPRYKGKKEEFIADWKAGKYNPGCPMCFEKEDVEELEVIREEVKNMIKYINNPFEDIVKIMNDIDPNINADIQFNPSLKGKDFGECGMVTFPADDSTPLIDISTNIPFEAMIEVLAHELAHIIAGEESEHNTEWNKAFQKIQIEWQLKHEDNGVTVEVAKYEKGTEDGFEYEDELECIDISIGMFKASVVDGVRLYPYVITSKGKRYISEQGE